MARWIIVGLIAGIAVGFTLNEHYLAAENEQLAALDVSISELDQRALQASDAALIAELESRRQGLGEERNAVLAAQEKKVEPFSLTADIFLRLVKMIIAPLVFSTLVVGVARVGDIASVGRIGGRTLLWFIGASLMSLLLGLVLVNVFEPGVAMQLPLPDEGESTGIVGAGLSLKTFLYHVFPTSVIDAMAKNEILQIVVFSLFFGVATAAIGEPGKIVIQMMDAIAHVILKVTTYVMYLAPIEVAAR